MFTGAIRWADMRRTLDHEMFAGCDSLAVPMRIGDKWTAKILRCLEHGPRRFSELLPPLRGITPKVLTASLRAMERDGMVSRTSYPEIPPRVEYELTPLGRSLFEPLAAQCAWTAAHLEDLLRSRDEYQSREA